LLCHSKRKLQRTESNVRVMITENIITSSNFNSISSAPEGFELKPLARKDVKVINAVWPGRDEFSERYLGNLVEYNVNMGMFDKNDVLVAWTLT
jgi:hypothetical protein